jgi:sodium transport system permease protein
MNFSLIALIFRKELLEALRDRRTLVFMFLAPILLYPALGVGFFQIALMQVNKVSEETVRIAFQGPPPPDRFLEILRSKGKFETVAPESPDDALQQRELQAIIEFPEGYAETLAAGQQIQVNIRYDDADERSNTAHYRIRDALDDYKLEILTERLKGRGLSVDFINPIAEKAKRAATPERRAGYHLGRFLPYLILLMIINGTMYPAIDITAGEKERGTLESLLATPPTPMEIMLAKFSLVFFFGILSAALNLASLGFTAASIFQNIQAYAPMPIVALSVSWKTMAMIAALLVPFTILFAALLVAIASFADSFKEAQIYIMPLFFVVVLPALVSALPGTALNGFWLVVPIANLCLLMKELFLEQASAEQVALVFACSCVYAGAALSLAVRVFSHEEVLFPREHAFALFRNWLSARKRPLSGLLTPKLSVSDALLVYALVFPLAYYAGTLATGASPRMSLLAQQWGVLLGVPLLLTWRARIDLRQTFLLRLPRPLAMTGMLFALAGSLLLIRKYAVFQNQWLPAPGLVEESLAKVLKEAAGGSLAGLLFLGALSPAVCEEFLFRGFILSGLRSRLSKWQSLILSAALFGALHMIIYQFVPTALLGVLLAWMAWESGSLLPGVVFHFLNNAFALTFLHFTDYGRVASAMVSGEGEGGSAWLAALGRFHSGDFSWLVTLLAAGLLVLGCWLMRKGGSA